MAVLLKSNTRTEYEGDLNVGRGQLGYGVNAAITADTDLWTGVYAGANSYILTPDATWAITLPTIGYTSTEAQPGHKLIIYNGSPTNVLNIQDSSTAAINTINGEKASIYLAESAPDTWRVVFDGSIGNTTLQQAYENNMDQGVTLNTVANTYGEFDIIAPNLAADNLREFLSVYGAGGIGVGGLYFRSGNTSANGFEPYVRINGALTTTPGIQSLASGVNSNATGTNSYAFGSNANATGLYSFSHGQNTTASGVSSIAFGTACSTNATAARAVAMGNAVAVSGTNSIGIGNTINIGIGSGNCLILGGGNIGLNTQRSALMGYANSLYTIPDSRNNSLTKLFPNGQYDLSDVTGYSDSDALAAGVNSAPAIFKRSGVVLDRAPGTSNNVTILNTTSVTSPLIFGTSMITVTVTGMSQANNGLAGVYAAGGKLRALVQVADDGGGNSTVLYQEMYKNTTEIPTLLPLGIVNFDLSMSIINASPNYSIQLTIVVPDSLTNPPPTNMSFNYHVKVEHCYTY